MVVRCCVSVVMELPPRARRILGLPKRLEPISGTTSACAENTRKAASLMVCWGNYLRVRGEYGKPERVLTHQEELPPRARRILTIGQTDRVTVGTTSACAENTVPPWLTTRSPWNYLRVRGEYLPPLHERLEQEELPPRARRILFYITLRRFRVGTTSACAENT